MADYRTVTGLFNLLTPPPMPALVWNYGRRAARIGKHNRNFKHGRGSARRQRRDYQVRDALSVRAELVAGGLIAFKGRRLRHSYRELLLEDLDHPSQVISATRAYARRLLSLMVLHGPESGWGVKQPAREGRGREKATPYLIPKKAEKCWRWWRQLCRETFRLLLHLDRLLTSMIPAHATRKKEGVVERGEDASSPHSLLLERGRGITAPVGVGALLPAALRAAGM